MAINTDPQAPIFSIADVCVVADLTTFIPAFITEVAKQKYGSRTDVPTPNS
ncbi:MAG: hypothetical protein WCG29_00710 [Desulfomonile sp.]